MPWRLEARGNCDSHVKEAGQPQDIPSLPDALHSEAEKGDGDCDEGTEHLHTSLQEQEAPSSIISNEGTDIGGEVVAGSNGNTSHQGNGAGGAEGQENLRSIEDEDVDSCTVQEGRVSSECLPIGRA